MAAVFLLTIIEYWIMRVIPRRQQNVGETSEQSSEIQ